MSEPVKLCDLDALAPGDIARVEIDGRPVAYARIGDTYHAIDDTCTHARVSLSEGIVDEDDCTIECPKHGAQFSLETGEALTLPAIQPVALHAIDVRESAVYITLSEDVE